MKTTIATIVFLMSFTFSYSQKLLTSWSQQNIEYYTKEMYDQAQKLSALELSEKNVNDEYWSEVFLTLNASLNNHSKDVDYLNLLVGQLTNKSETKLKGTSRLIIWDRISNGDLTFEGRGLVFENDLFTVAGRANQILQSLIAKNFGYVTMESTEKELEELKTNWMSYLAGNTVSVFTPNNYKNAKIPEISSLAAVKALIFSLQDNPKKQEITKTCLKNTYNLDEMPKDKSDSAIFCNPDNYTYPYLKSVFGENKIYRSKNSKWWLEFWNKNQNQLYWNSEKGIYEVKRQHS